MKRTPSLRRLVRLSACAAVVLLAACSEQALYSQLSERQANEMVAVLRSAGIKADKQGKDGQYAVLTAASDFAQAVRILNEQGYPRESFDSMGKVFKREGFVSTPLEERARLVFAMSQEIANTLTNIDGVITARVHLVVPEKNPLLDKPQPASASVFIKHRPDRDLTSQEAQIKALVVNSLEGLSYDRVTVSLFPAESLSAAPPAKAAPASAPTQRVESSWPLLAGTGVGALALSGGGLLWWRRRGAPAAGSDATEPEHRQETLASSELQAVLTRAAQRK